MYLSLSNIDGLNIPLIDEKYLKKLISSLNKKKIKKASKKTFSKEKLFSKILAELNVEPHKTSKKLKKSSLEDSFKNILSKLNVENDFEECDEYEEYECEEKVKIKKSDFESKDTSIKIASKEIKDSHYQVDVSKDFVNKNGKNLIMVSAYVRDAYLGKYIRKRNYYYLDQNEESANDSYSEIVKKCNRIKRNYHSGNMNINSVVSEIFNVLGGIISDVKFKEEDELNNIKRN